MRLKDKYLVLDVETANSTDQPLVYDIGFAICDNKGNVELEESYIVSDIFFDEEKILGNKDLMNTAYYHDKLPKYFEGLRKGLWKVAPLLVIRKRILEIIKKYRIKAVCAYNASFDMNALNWTLRYVTKSRCRWFFPYNTQVYCIWHMACQTIFSKKDFCKEAFENGWESEKGNCQTSAEIAWRYLTKDYEFSEAHTGLEDVKIECQIMAQCFKAHKKMVRSINRLCWRLPQKKYKEVKEKETQKTIDTLEI